MERYLNWLKFDWHYWDIKPLFPKDLAINYERQNFSEFSKKSIEF